MAVHPELLPAPTKGEWWSAGDGTACRVVTAWRAGVNAGVVVRWPKGTEGRRALWSYADFVSRFAPLQRDLLTDIGAGH